MGKGNKARLIPERAEDGGPFQGPFPPLKAATDNLGVIRWYRCPMKRGTLGKLMQRSDTQGLFQACGHFAIWLTTAVSVHQAWVTGAYFCYLGALFMHGTVGSTMVYGCHEMGHGTPFKTRWLNNVFLYLYSLLFWWDPYEYAASHTYHHRYSQYPESDRENLFPLEPSLDPYLMIQLFTVNLSSPSRVFGKGGLLSCIQLTCKAAMGGIAAPEGSPNHEWLTAVHADQPKQALRSKRWSQVLCMFHLVVALYSLVTGQPILIVIISLHSFFGNWLSYFVGSCQHMGLRQGTPDFRKNTRSITLPFVCEFLFWRMNWHIEHHMFAAIPCYNLKAAHEATRPFMPEPRTLIGAWREMRDTWHKQQADPTYEFDTPVPDGSTANNHNEHLETDEALGGSIGNLAPDELKKTE